MSNLLAGLVPAYIEILPPGFGTVTFAYNPDDLTITSHAQWEATPQPGATSGAGKPQYQGKRSEQMSVRMILDTFAVPPTPPEPNIEILKQALSPSVVPDPSGGMEPPHVMFGWGANIVMDEGYVTSLSVTYKRFLAGVPVRAEVELGLQAIPTIVPFTNPTSGGRTRVRSHTVVEGDTLASVAYQTYKDPNKWRLLATANGIDDPMRLRSGTVLVVPDPREAGEIG